MFIIYLLHNLKDETCAKTGNGNYGTLCKTWSYFRKNRRGWHLIKKWRKSRIELKIVCKTSVFKQFS